MAEQSLKGAAIAFGVTVVGSVVASAIFVFLPLKPKDAAGARLEVPRFEHVIETSADVLAFQDFLGNNLGKLVYINADVASTLSKVHGEEPDQSIGIAATPSNLEERAYEFNCVIKGTAHSLHFYHSGHNVFSGYFTVAPRVDMHQGRNFGLESVPADRVLVHSQLR